MHERTWTDPRDGTEWTVTYNPAVELARPEERVRRSRIVFEAGDRRLHADAVYGSGLDTLTDDDLQGLLDRARAVRSEEDETPWGAEEEAPGDG